MYADDAALWFDIRLIRYDILHEIKAEKGLQTYHAIVDSINIGILFWYIYHMRQW